MTKEAAEKTTNTSSGDTSFVAGRLVTDFLDTAWRIAIPVILFAVMGIVADRNFSTAPWLTLLGVILGFCLAGWLVKKQLDKVGGSGK